MIRVIAVAVIEWRDRVLVGLRPEGVPLAGYFEFPGGKLAAGETPAEAAEREAREETGLAVEVLGAWATVEHHYDHGPLRLHFLRCVPKPPEQSSSTPSAPAGLPSSAVSSAERAGAPAGLPSSAEATDSLVDDAAPPVVRPPFAWVPRRDLPSYRFPAANAEVLALLAATRLGPDLQTG